jgi:acyl-CoA oxidase
MVIKGVDHGIQTFMVPIRNPKTGKTYDGIEAGDIGPKYGFNIKDNGYMILTNYRIPRKNLLCRYTQVDREGNVSQHGD